MRDLSEKEISNLKAFLAQESDERATFLEGFDEALVGACMRGDMDYPRASYSVEKIIDMLVDREGITNEQAYVFFNENLLSASDSEGSPFFIERGSNEMDEDLVIETFSSTTTSEE